jgi:TatD DNase family protein
MLVDAHIHIDRYEDDLPVALHEIEEHSILTIANSMDPDSYARTLKISGGSRFIIPTFGVHPWNAPEYVGRLDELEPLIARSPMLGEIGLDRRFVEDTSTYPAQQEIFEFFLEAAANDEKIVNLHTAGAEETVADLLDRHGISRVIVHWYSGPVETFERLVERGAFFTVGVEVRSSEHIRTLAKRIPTQLLLTETDNPGGERWLSGHPGMPGLIRNVVAELAAIRETSETEIIETVKRNLARLIDGDSRLAELSALLVGGTEVTSGIESAHEVSWVDPARTAGADAEAMGDSTTDED